MKKFVFAMLLGIILYGCGSDNDADKGLELIEAQLVEKEYRSVELHERGEVCDELEDGSYSCRYAYGYWSIRFEEDEVIWDSSDTINIGSYQVTSSDSLEFDFGGPSIYTAELAIDLSSITLIGIVYEREEIE